jgi:nicotinamidase-related amidase
MEEMMQHKMMQHKEHLTALPDASFFQECAFICVDLQQNGDVAETEPHYITEAQMPDLWKQMGFGFEDVNDAIRHAVTICLPNAARVTAACRRLGMPMIFIHWGSRYPDLIDIDPESRGELYFGPGSERNAYTPESHVRPAAALNVQPGEYVLAKTAQDAFIGTPLRFMLRNLGVKNLILIGGHTGACLGKTSKSARSLGYRTLCVDDATNNAFESNRIAKILECGYDYIVETMALESLIA